MKRILVLVLSLLGLAAAPALAEPEVFSKSGFKADQQAAIAGHKLQVAYFTATWCPPCKKMKAETWVDEKIESWADANAIVTPIDIDENRALATEYRVRSIPTIVVLLGDEEIGRTLGYQSPGKFHDWLDGFRASHLDPARKAATSRPAPGADSDKLIAPAEAGAGLSAKEAIDMYNTQARKDTTGFGVTGSVLLPRLAELASTDSALKSELAERVKQLAERVGSDAANMNDVREYLQLAPIAGLQDQAAAWIEERLASPQTAAVIERNKYLAVQVLTEVGKYAEAADLAGDPVMHARMLLSSASKSAGKAMKDLDASLAGAFESGQTDLLRRHVADAVAMALSRGEQAKAKAIARLFPGGETSKDQAAIDAAAKRAGVEPIQISD